MLSGERPPGLEVRPGATRMIIGSRCSSSLPCGVISPPRSPLGRRSASFLPPGGTTAAPLTHRGHNVHLASREPQYDAIIVGSGMTGGWAAKELTEKGLRTLVLEAGRPIDPARDYVEHVQAWELPFRGRGDRKVVDRDQPIQKRCYACDEWGSKFFVNDRENPYEFDEDKPFLWIRGRQVGGRSIMWGRQVYRWRDLDFEDNAREGVGVDWPIRYREL